VEHADVLGVHAVVALIVSIIVLRLIRRACVTSAGFLAGATRTFLWRIARHDLVRRPPGGSCPIPATVSLNRSHFLDVHALPATAPP
jgi:hypothetical protein